MIVGILVLWQVIGLAVEAIVIPPMLIKYLRRPPKNERLEQAVEKAWETTQKAAVAETCCCDSVAPPDMAEFYAKMAEVVNLRKQIYAEKEQLKENLAVRMTRQKYAEVAQHLGMAPLLEEVEGKTCVGKIYGAQVILDDGAEEPTVEDK